MERQEGWEGESRNASHPQMRLILCVWSFSSASDLRAAWVIFAAIYSSDT